MGKTLMPKYRFDTESPALIDGIVENHRILSPNGIRTGDFVKFTKKSMPIISETISDTIHDDFTIVHIDKTHVLILYQDSNPDTLNYGVAKLLKVSKNKMTVSDKIIFTTSAISDINAVRLTENEIFVVYSDIGHNGYGTAKLLNVLNDEISIGMSLVFTSSDISDIAVTRMSDMSACIAYSDHGNNGYGTLIKLLINKTTIQLSKSTPTPIVFHAGDVINISLCMIDDTYCAITYDSNGKAYADRFHIYNGIKNYSSLLISESLSPQLSITPITEGYFAVFTGSDSEGKAIIISSNPTDITIVDTVTFNEGKTSNVSATLFDNSKVGVVYTDDTFNGKMSVLTHIQGKFVITYTDYITDFAITNSKIADVTISSGIIVYNAIKKNIGECLLCSISDIGIAPANNRFVAEGISLDNGEYHQFANIKTKSDEIENMIGEFTAVSDENIDIGDFVNFVNNYKQTAYTANDPTDLLEGNTQYTVSKIDDERVLLTYLKPDEEVGGSSPALCIIKVVGNTVEFGNKVILTPRLSGVTKKAALHIDGAVFDDNKIITVFGYNNSPGYVVLSTYDDMTITQTDATLDLYTMMDNGSSTVYTATYFTVTKLDETRAFISYCLGNGDYSTSSKRIFRGHVLEIDGNTMSKGPIIDLSQPAMSVDYSHAVARLLDKDKIIMAYSTSANDTSVALTIYTFDGSELKTKSPMFTVPQGSITKLALEVIDRHGVVLAAFDNMDLGTNPRPRYLYVINIDSEDNMSMPTSNIIQYTAGQLGIVQGDLVKISNNKFMLTFSDRNKATTTMVSRILYIEGPDKELQLSEPYSNSVYSERIESISLNPYKSIIVYTRIQPSPSSVCALILGHELDIPASNFNETVVESRSITPSNISIGSDAVVVSKNNSNNTYNVRAISPFTNRLNEQQIIRAQIAESPINAGDFITYTTPGDFTMVKKTTTNDIRGVAVESGLPGEYIDVRTLYQ